MPRVVYTAGFLTEANKTNISPQVVGMVELSNNAFAAGSVFGHTTYPLPAPFNYGGRLRDVSSLDFSLNGGVGRVTFSISNADLAEVPNVANDNYIGWECKVHKILILDDGTVTGILLLHGVVTSYTMTDQVVDMDVTTRINVTNSINNRRVGKKCPWVFKGTECGYNGLLTTCNKLYSSADGCQGRDNQHRFGGFPERESLASIGVVSGQGSSPGYILTETFSEQVVTANTTVTATDLRYLKCDHSAPITITLPNPSNFPDNGQPITIKDCSSPGATTNNITINAAGGGTVNGGTFAITSSNGAVTLSADKLNGDWRIVADYNSTPASASGTVTSVALNPPAGFMTVTGSPITSSGSFDLDLTIQGVNQVFAGPSSGVTPLAPEFRSLVLADLPAISTNRLLGRTASGTGVVQEITIGTGVLTWLQTPSAENLLAAVQGTTGTGGLVFNTSPVFNSSITLDDNGELRLREQFGNGSNYIGFKAPISIANNLVWTLPASDGSNGQFLSTNGSGVLSWATASGGSITDGDKGDITVSSSGTVWTVDNKAVTLAKMQDISTDRILGRVSASSGDIEEIAPGTGILTWLQTPSSANLATAITDETGTGKLVFSVNPELEVPYIDSIRAWVAPSTLGGRVLRFTHSSGGGNNCIEIVNAANSGTPVIRAFGSSDSNVPLGLTAKGSSPVITTATSFRVEGLTVSGVTEPGIIEARGGNQLYGGGKIYLYERSTNGNNYVGFEAPDSLASDLFWTLPATDGTVNQALVTDGGAGLSWKSFEVPLTFSTGLTRTTNTITVNTTQNIVRLLNLTTNGFIKATNADGTLSVDTSTYLTGNQTITLSGDVSGSGSTSIATTIANDAVTFAKVQNITSGVILGRTTASTGDIEEITPGSGVLAWLQDATSAKLAAAVTDETGSGSLVFATSPTLVTPRVNLIHTATSPNNPVLGFGQSASSVNYLQISNAATGLTPVLEAVGSDSNIGVNIKAKNVEPIRLQTDSGLVVEPVTSTAGFYGSIDVRGGTGAGDGATIGLRNPGNGGFVGFIAPDTITTSILYELPSADGANGQVLRTNGSGVLSWVNQPTALTDGDKGDIVVSSSGTTWTIDTDVVTFAKMQNITTGRLLGRTANGNGDIQELSVTVPLLLQSGNLTFSTQNAFHVFAGPTPSFRALTTADLPDLSSIYLPVTTPIPQGTVTSIGMTVPSFLSVSPSTITSSGTFAVSLVNQNANLVFAGPASGIPQPPTFRSLVAADIPNLSSIYQPLDADLTGIAGLTGDGLIRKTSGTWGMDSNVYLTANQTITLSGDVTGSGSTSITTTIANGAVTFAKFQNIASGRLLGRTTASNGIVEEISVGAGLSLSSGVLSSTSSGGTVTSVALTVPAFLSVSGSPITTSGTIAITIPNANANVVFAGPLSGSAAQPTFRSLVLADLPTINTNRLLGRVSASSGIVEEVTPGAGVLDWLQDPTSTKLAIAVTDETGSGSLVFGTSPSFTTSATFVDNAEIRFAELAINGSNYVGFKASSSLSANTIWTLPSVDGSNGQVLVTNGTGGLSWASVSGSGITDGDKGDIVVSGSGLTWTIDNSAVTLAKMADLVTDRLIGRDSSGTGAPEALTVGGGIEFTGSGGIQTSAFTGDVTKTAGGTALTIANDAVTYAKMQNVSADRVLGRRTSIGDPEELTLSQTLDLVGSAAQGDILYRDASSWTRLGAGTRGRYLQTAGASANPAWANDVNFKNLLINGDMSISQRNGTTNTSISDDVYALDRWYVLTQTAAIQVQQQSNQENGTPFNSRLTQNQATAQRMGYAQIIEGKNCRHLRGQQVTLSFRVRCSSSQAIRYAILEWTGTEDAVTSDVVNSWTSATYSTGNFFISTTTTIPSNGVTSTTPSANTWTDVTPLTVTLGTSFNNLTVFIWTEGTAANSVTLDISRVQLEPGPVATEFEYLPIDIQYDRCLRYCQKYGEYVTSVRRTVLFGGASFGGADKWAYTYIPFSVRMRTQPSGATFSAAGDWDVFSTYNSLVYTFTGWILSQVDTAGAFIISTGVTRTGGPALPDGYVTILLANNSNAFILFETEL